MWDVEGGDRDEADGAGRARRTEPLDDPQPRRPVATRGEGLGNDQLAIDRAPRTREIDEIFGAVASVRGGQPPAIMDAAIDADDAPQDFAGLGFPGQGFAV